MYYMWHEFLNGYWTGFWPEIWSGGTAFGTFALAAATFCLIRQTHGENLRTEQYHQDQFKPICILQQYGDLITKSFRNIEGEQIKVSIKSDLMVKNVGTGPAFDFEINIVNYDGEKFIKLFDDGINNVIAIETNKIYQFSCINGQNKSILIDEKERLPFSTPGFLIGEFIIKDNLKDMVSSFEKRFLYFEIIYRDIFGKQFACNRSHPPFACI